MDTGHKAGKVLDSLEKEFPDARIALCFKTPFELLVATILSARTTDRSVNALTPALFERFPSPGAFAASSIEDIEALICSINFFRNKARSILACSKKIVHDFGGAVPDTLEGLMTLAGVGRKTANVVLGNAFGRDAIGVDTHVKRVSQRLGLAESDDPDEIEAELCRIIPKDRWTKTTLLFILHGRNTCKAKNPACAVCPINRFCDYWRNKAG